MHVNINIEITVKFTNNHINSLCNNVRSKREKEKIRSKTTPRNGIVHRNEMMLIMHFAFAIGDKIVRSCVNLLAHEFTQSVRLA